MASQHGEAGRDPSGTIRKSARPQDNRAGRARLRVLSGYERPPTSGMGVLDATWQSPPLAFLGQ